MKEVVKVSLILLVIVLVCSDVYAIIGVSPGSYEVDFQPNLKKSFGFSFIFDRGVEAEVYAEGDLAEYVRLNKKSLNGPEGVVATLELPAVIEKPGTHIIFIGARQGTPKGVGIALVGNIRGIIKVKVPYPGKYAEVEMITNNANTGEPIQFQIFVKNLGKENIFAYTQIDISGSQGNVETLNLGAQSIESTKTLKLVESINTERYKPGNYNASVSVSYDEGKTAKTSGIFRLGELYANVSDYTKEFERDKINRFEIEVESFWNDPIEGLYANVSIIGYKLDFKTISINLAPWKKDLLTGFFDTTPIKEDEFQAKVDLSYHGKVTSQIVDLKFKKETNYALYGIIISIVAIVITLVIIILILLKKIKKKKK